MDFFEAQARAHRRTHRLVVLFILAVGATIGASYFATIFLLGQMSGRSSHHRYDQDETDYAAPAQSLWQPDVLAIVAGGTILVVGAAALFKWSELHSGGAAVAEMVGGRKVDPHTTDLHERRLLNVVEEMAIAAGITVPAVYVLDNEAGLNAFAAGLTTSDAIVAVTRGTLQKLSRDELQGVIGHEFSHILNGDMRMNLRLTAVIFGIFVLTIIGRGLLRSMSFGGRGRRGDNKGAAVMLAAGVVLLIVGFIGYFFGRLIQAAVSRQREFLADASSVQFTRNPGGITGALKKIGGFAIGGSIDTEKAAQIGHFFFAEAFTAGFSGLWATHPPLGERILAIDPQFDGKFVEPPETVDVAHESFVAAGLAPRPRSPAPRPAGPGPSPLGIVATIGTLSAANVADAQDLLSATPPRLREAARSPTEAPVLLYGLLLDDDGAVRRKQLDSVSSHAGPDALRILQELEPSLGQLKPAHKLPLLQIALPALRGLAAESVQPLMATLDELVGADGRTSAFEFALQKLVRCSLAAGQAPRSVIVQIYSFNAVAAEISVVLSALAHASSNDAAAATEAFAAGAGQLKLLEGRLALLAAEASGFAQLDAALDKLATASLPIKQRLITAAAHVVSADGVLLVAEAELLRTVSAVLDVPMPPLAPGEAA